MKKAIGGSVIAGLRSLLDCVDALNLVAERLITPTWWHRHHHRPRRVFFLTLSVTPQAVARLETKHGEIAVEAHYYSGPATSDVGHEIGVEVHDIAATNLYTLSPPGPYGSFSSVVITGKAVATKIDTLGSDPTVTVMASVPDSSLACTTYSAPLNAARHTPGESDVTWRPCLPLRRRVSRR